jgi:hypothetical protein
MRNPNLGNSEITLWVLKLMLAEFFEGTKATD